VAIYIHCGTSNFITKRDSVLRTLPRKLKMIMNSFKTTIKPDMRGVVNVRQNVVKLISLTVWGHHRVRSMARLKSYHHDVAKNIDFSGK
jgi:hypothetical protein